MQKGLEMLFLKPIAVGKRVVLSFNAVPELESVTKNPAGPRSNLVANNSAAILVLLGLLQLRSHSGCRGSFR
jgi:hypothetical protein